MNRATLLRLAVFVCLCAASQAFAWEFTVTNWSNAVQDVEARYSGGTCRADRTLIGIGHTATFDAKACLLSEITLHAPATAVPYKGPVHGIYTQFYIIGPIDGIYRVGRLELD